MTIQLAKPCEIPIRHHATEGNVFEDNWGIVPSAIGRDPDSIGDLNLGRRPLRHCDFRHTGKALRPAIWRVPRNFIATGISIYRKETTPLWDVNLAEMGTESEQKSCSSARLRGGSIGGVHAAGSRGYFLFSTSATSDKDHHARPRAQHAPRC
jgi:hypothetical protein